MAAFDKKGTTFGHGRNIAATAFRRGRNVSHQGAYGGGATIIFVAALVIMLAAVSSGTCAWAQAPSNRPKLILLLVGDQFAYDYLSRYQDRLAAGGFRLLIDRGAVFTSCKYGDGTTQSAVGHSIISSGAYPWATGIVADSWFDRRKGKSISAVSEDGLTVVGANGTAGGTHLMHGTTIGDEMKLASNGRSKVISVSLKPESSLFLAGRLASEAFWWDTNTGVFVTSSQFGHELPSWAQAFNDQHY
ncbi:MAG: alkaline phosphatase family protein, partial [Candidatus Binatia bacterium]